MTAVTPATDLREGGLKAPVRHPYDRDGPDFADPQKLEDEMTRVFDICHGCRRCLSLCDSFPRLFDLVDNSPTGELDSVDKSRYHEVADACTLCDMCFMASCPYVPPHEFNIDFPHLITRFRAVAEKREPRGRTLTFIDRNARFAKMAPWLANLMSDRRNKPARLLMKILFGVHPDAELPKFARRTFTSAATRRAAAAKKKSAATATATATEKGAATATATTTTTDGAETVTATATEKGGEVKETKRKVVVYATCFVENHHTETGHAAMALFAANGVEAVPVYPSCCGMPRLERADLDAVGGAARRVADALVPWIDEGYEVVALTPSCALMLKFEWPQLLPDDPDIKKLAAATFDVAEYLMALRRAGQLVTEAKPLEGGIFLHLACHARAQNVGFKARDLLKLIPETELHFAARCSGHGGLWGCLDEHFETAHRVGAPVAKHIARSGARYLATECPLAGLHLTQGVERLGADGKGAGKGDGKGAGKGAGKGDSNGAAGGSSDGDAAGNSDGDKGVARDAKHPIVLYAEACGLEF